MSRSHQTFAKKENERKRREKQLEKQKLRNQRKLEKELQGKISLDDRIAELDEDGNIIETQKEVKVNENLKTGTVKFISKDKGFGFIIGDMKKDKILFHLKDAGDELKVKDQVMFEMGDSPRGPIAIDIFLRDA